MYVMINPWFDWQLNVIMWCFYGQDNLVRVAVSGVSISEAATGVNYLASRQRNEAVSDSYPGISRR